MLVFIPGIIESRPVNLLGMLRQYVRDILQKIFQCFVWYGGSPERILMTEDFVWGAQAILKQANGWSKQLQFTYRCSSISNKLDLPISACNKR